MKRFFSFVGQIFIRTWSSLDWKWHYIISDYCLFPLLFYVLKYRRKVVQENVRYAFPILSLEKRAGIEKAFYRYVSDVLVETVKGFTLSEKELRARIAFEPFPVFSTQNDEKKTCLLLIGHLGNQELIAKCLPFMTNLPVKIPYRKIKPYWVEKWVNNSRSQFGAELFPAEKPAYSLRNDSNPFLLALAADQAANPSKSYWVSFLGREATFFKGPEKWANWLDCPVVYADVTRPRRGFYEIKFEIISDTPSILKPSELTEKYARLLEESIRRDPHIWLWSHRKWKHRKS